LSPASTPLKRGGRARAHRPVEPVLRDVGREDAAGAQREREPDVEQSADAAAHDQHRRAGSHAGARLGAHHAPQRLDERAFLVGHGVRHLQDARSVCSAGTRTYCANPPGSKLVVCQRVAGGVVAGGQYRQVFVGHVVADHDAVAKL